MRGISAAWWAFAFLGVYIASTRPDRFVRLLSDRLILLIVCFCSVAAVVESFHPLSAYVEIRSLIQIGVATALIATLCSDRAAVKAAFTGLLVLSLSLGATIILSSYHLLSQVTISSGAEARELRDELVEAFVLDININRAAFLCGLGAPVAIAFALVARTQVQRLLLGAMAVIIVAAVCFSLSRGGIATTITGVCVMLLSYKGSRVVAGAIGLGMFVAVFLLIPDAALQRFVSFERRETGESQDARVNILETAVRTFPEYASVGIGCGNYWQQWGPMNGMFSVRYRVTFGTHNSFLQIWVYWGGVGLVAFLAFLWTAARYVPRQRAADPLAAALVGLATAGVLRLAFTHSFFLKDFALVLALLLAAHRYVWPRNLPTGPRLRSASVRF